MRLLHSANIALQPSAVASANHSLHTARRPSRKATIALTMASDNVEQRSWDSFIDWNGPNWVADAMQRDLQHNPVVAASEDAATTG